MSNLLTIKQIESNCVFVNICIVEKVLGAYIYNQDFRQKE